MRSAGMARVFPPPVRLPLPVSSGWIESSPRLIRDESGRFVLAFLSNRDARHTMRLYTCWSRDLIHWSAPALVGEDVGGVYDLMQDRDGRSLLVTARSTLDSHGECRERTLVVLASRTTIAGRNLGRMAVDVALEPGGVRLLQRDDGRYEVLLAAGKTELRPTPTVTLWRYLSIDGARWSPTQRIAEAAWKGDPILSAVHAGGRTVLACFAAQVWDPDLGMVFQTEDGQRIENRPRRRLRLCDAAGRLR